MSDASERPLGELELAVMEVLWRRSPASVSLSYTFDTFWKPAPAAPSWNLP